jgi:ABC-type oligopeptide transport system substrate-binding subunit
MKSNLLFYFVFGWSCFCLAGTQKERQKENSISILIDERPETFASHKCASIFCSSLNVLIHEGLYTNGPKDELVLNARRHQVTMDGLVHIFELEEARWSNGDLITAQHYVNGFQALVDPKQAAGLGTVAVQARIKNALPVSKKLKPVSALGVKALNPKTLQITLETPNHLLPHYLKNTIFAPIQNHPSDSYGIDPLKVLSSGAFMFVKNRKDELFRLKRNPYYKRKDLFNLNPIQEISIVMATSEALPKANAFLSGQIDFLHVTSTETVRQIQKKQPNINLSPKSSNSISFFIFNQAHNHWRSKEFRSVIANLIDRSRLAKTVDRPLQIINRLISEFAPGLNGKGFQSQFKFEPFKYSKEEGLKTYRKLKEDAFPFPKTIRYLSSNQADRLHVAQGIKAQIEQHLPIKVEIISMETQRFFPALRDNNYDMAEKGWMPDVPDFHNSLAIFEGDQSPAFNSARVRDPDYDKIIQISKKMNPTSAQALAFAAERHLIENYYTIPFYTDLYYPVSTPYLKGVLTSPNDGHEYDLRYAYWEEKPKNIQAKNTLK